MRRALLLSSGVGAALVLAVFVGAAAANTGAPVFYDARYPAPASTAPEGYEVGQGGGGAPGEAEPIGDEEGADHLPPPGSAPGPTAPATPPSTTPQQPSAPATPPPTATPAPTPEPAPEHDPDGPASDEPDDPSARGALTTEEQQAWLAFQQIVRECMAGAGHEYLYWEWWNPAPDASNRFPAMPADLAADEAAAWNLALNGDAPAGATSEWKDAGCWGYAVHVTGGTH